MHSVVVRIYKCKFKELEAENCRKKKEIIKTTTTKTTKTIKSTANPTPF